MWCAHGVLVRRAAERMCKDVADQCMTWWGMEVQKNAGAVKGCAEMRTDVSANETGRLHEVITHHVWLAVAFVKASLLLISCLLSFFQKGNNTHMPCPTKSTLAASEPQQVLVVLSHRWQCHGGHFAPPCARPLQSTLG
jgi:hypothetical protein